MVGSSKSTVEDEIIVSVPEGKLRGTIRYNRRGRKIYTFLSIPYAIPPVGSLRFKGPKPLQSWHGILDATKEPPPCYQWAPVTYEIIGSEDCLYLNVYTPQVKKSGALFPVMVFIHGGFFIWGSGNPSVYGPEYVCTRNIVLVTINYRLGFLGFLSFKNSSIVPGNAGLKDQVMALKWIKRNIVHFQGDSNNITIFGQCAGAASVHLHILSRASQGLFHKAIMQSGCALNPWVNGVKDTGITVGQYFGRQDSNEAEILDYLQKENVDRLWLAQLEIVRRLQVNEKWICSPVIEEHISEGTFLRQHPLETILSGNYNHVPTIIGYNNLEGMHWDIHNLLHKGHSEFVTDYTTVIPNNINCYKCGLYNKTLQEKIKAHYFGYTKDDPALWDKMPLFDLYTDIFWLRGIYSTIRNHLATSDSPIYFYRFAGDTYLNLSKRLCAPFKANCSYKGASNGDELCYLFQIFNKTWDVTKGSCEEMCIKRMVHLWTNFAYCGDPTPNVTSTLNERWLPASKNDMFCMDIEDVMGINLEPDLERMKFWDLIYCNDCRTRRL